MTQGQSRFGRKHLRHLRSPRTGGFNGTHCDIANINARGTLALARIPIGCFDCSPIETAYPAGLINATGMGRQPGQHR